MNHASDASAAPQHDTFGWGSLGYLMQPKTYGGLSMTRACSLLFLLLPLLGFAQNSIGPAQWQHDIVLLRDGLRERVPRVFSEKYSLKNFEADLNALSQKVVGRSDVDIALDLQVIVARLNNSMLRLDIADLLQTDKVVPLGLSTLSDGVFVTGTVKRFEKMMRSKVLSVNNVDIEEVYRRLGQFVSKDNEQTLRRDGLQWLRFPAAFRKAGISTTDTLYFAVQNERGGHDFHKVFPLDPARNQKDMVPNILSPRSPDLRWRTEPLLWDLHWLESDSVVYFQYNGCLSQEVALLKGDSAMASRLPRIQPIMDSIVHLMTQHPNHRFFFDLRLNGGGFTYDGFRLADQLAALPEVNRKGRIYVAIAWFTGLEAMQVADYFRQKTRAQLLGEPTAERPGRSNPVGSFSLPNSGIRVIYPASVSQPDGKGPNALQPDVLIQRTFNDFRLGRDPVLDWAKQN